MITIYMCNMHDWRLIKKSLKINIDFASFYIKVSTRHKLYFTGITGQIGDHTINHVCWVSQ